MSEATEAGQPGTASVQRPGTEFADSAGEADPTDEHAVPVRAEGISLCGRYEGAGYAEPRYLLSRADGQMVLVSELLYRVTEQIDGQRTLREIADRITADCGKQLSVPGVEYLINDKLHELGVATLAEPVAKAPRADPLIALAMRGVLLPARFVRPLAAVLAPLFQPALVVAVLCALVIVDVALVSSGALDPAFHRAVGDPAQVLSVMALVIGSTFFHETGHAAACRYGGARPGSIGVGILLVIPAFYTNVTDAYRLDRTGRLRTDLGGLYFNAIFILGAAGVFWATHFPPLMVFIVLSHIQMLQQLLPLIRLDGYYILGDLVGVPNLFAHVRPFLQRLAGKHRLAGQPAGGALRPRVRMIVTAWVMVVVPVLGLAMVSLLVRVPRYLETALTRGGSFWNAGVAGLEQGQTLAGVLAIVSLVVVLLPWLGATAFLLRIGRKVFVGYRRKHPRHQPRHRAQLAHRRAARTP